jgi:hypothetical protein
MATKAAVLFRDQYFVGHSHADCVEEIFQTFCGGSFRKREELCHIIDEKIEPIVFGHVIDKEFNAIQDEARQEGSRGWYFAPMKM